MYYIKNKKLVFKNKVYKVFSNKVASKYSEIPNYLSLEVNSYPYGGVSCIIEYKKKIALMKINSFLCKKKFYCINQGFIENKEKAIDCIVREILEETGFKLNKKIFKKITTIYPMQSLISSKMCIFHAKLIDNDIKEKRKVFYETNSSHIKFYERQKIIQMLKKPSNFDLITYSALTYFIFSK